jgi:hypothetical protein
MNLFHNEMVGRPAISEASHKQYLPYPAAVEIGILPHNELKPRMSPQDAALRILNGYMPIGAGLVELPNQELAAFDLVAARIRKPDITVLPTYKEAVDDDNDAILQEGLVILSSRKGWMKAVGLVRVGDNSAWNNNGCPETKSTYHNTNLSGVIRFLPFGLDSEKYEISDIGSDGQITAAKQRRYF